MSNLDRENNKKKQEIEQFREQMKQKIAMCGDNDAEKQRYLDQLASYENTLTEQMKAETENQNQQLLSVLEKRRNRRKNIKDKISAKKEQKILNDFKKGANNKVNIQLNIQRTTGITNRIQAGFEKDEQVQVSENFMDRKNKQELIDLMQSLFDERANALRKFMYELMKQK